MDNEEDLRPSRWGGRLFSLGAGVAAATVALSAYAFACRVPEGMMSDQLGPLTLVMGASAVLLFLATLVVAALGVRALRGRDTSRLLSVTVAALVAATAYAYLGDTARDAAAAVSGPGGRPVVAWAQASWLMLTVAAVLVLVGSVAGRHGRPSFATMAAPLGVGVVVALSVGVGLGAAAAPTDYRSAQAQEIEVPGLPTAMGRDIAYSVVARGPGWIVPAGPGFVAPDSDGLVAYDGVTGAPRWRFPFSAFPRDATRWRCDPPAAPRTPWCSSNAAATTSPATRLAAPPSWPGSTR